MSTAADLANYYPDRKLMTAFLFTPAGEPESCHYSPLIYAEICMYSNVWQPDKEGRIHCMNDSVLDGFFRLTTGLCKLSFFEASRETGFNSLFGSGQHRGVCWSMMLMQKMHNAWSQQTVRFIDREIAHMLGVLNHWISSRRESYQEPVKSKPDFSGFWFMSALRLSVHYMLSANGSRPKNDPAKWFW